MSAAAKSPGKFTISQAIDSLGVSKFTISIFFLVGIAMMFDGYDYMIISYTNTQIMQEFFGPAGNDALKGALSSWSTIGIVVGSFAAGPLSDKFGRKKILTIGTFMYGLLPFRASSRRTTRSSRSSACSPACSWACARLSSPRCSRSSPPRSSVRSSSRSAWRG
ncbi:MAG: MFS transporter [Gordonibacter pamelaeae]